ncbi:extensin family protein [Sphingomonas hylomeconis]|uniref:Extensin family protein n=1 Tax=Sphingomonas hylomeconis TaxID=1395958 RepID=A0ABV7SQE2_9SPHN|nr:extensin family protein [Sphingomonas hylomeconis]
MTRIALLLLALALSACGGGDDRRPPPRPAGSKPVTLNLPTSQETRACFADLSREGIRFSPLPDRDYGGGCTLIGAVQLIDIGLPVAGIKGMRCGVARGFVGWARNAIAPAARQMLGSDVVRVETMGTYACRNVVGQAGRPARLSGHASGNAIDVSAFILRDGRRISIERDWRSADPAVRDFLQTIRKSACRRFGTVLSPDYNAAHYNHLHLEDDRATFCR